MAYEPLINQSSYDDVNYFALQFDTIIEKYYKKLSNINLTNDDSDMSDEECEKSIFNSKYDLLDKQFD